MPVTLIRSSWSSGSLIFHEATSIAPSTTYNVLKIGTTAVQVGDTANLVDFAWYATGSASVVISASGTSFTLVGVNMATDAPVVITDTTATTNTSTGALIVSGGIAGKLDIACGNDLLLVSSGAVINFNAGNVTITHAAGALACTGALTLSIATASNSTTSGALIVTGGVGIAKELYVGLTSSLAGAITAGSTLGIAGLITSTSVTGFRSNATFAPDANRTNYGLAIGTRANALTVTMTGSNDQNLDPIQLNLLVAGANPGNSSTLNASYMLITHSTAMTNMRLKCADWNVAVSANVLDAYVFQGELVCSGGPTIGNEVSLVGLVLDAGAGAVTCGSWSGITLTMRGAGIPAIAYGININNAGAGTLLHGIRILASATITNGITFGTAAGYGPTYAFAFPAAGPWSATQATGDSGKIAIKIGADTRYLNVWTS